jgi:hypothetical protein
VPEPTDLDEQLADAARQEALLTPEYFARLVDRSRIEYDPSGQASNLRDLARRWRRDHPWWLDESADPVEAPRPVRRASSEGGEREHAYWLERTKAARDAAAAARQQPPAEFTDALGRLKQRTSEATERAAKLLEPPTPPPSPAEQLNAALRRLGKGGGSLEEAASAFRASRRTRTFSAGKLSSKPNNEEV